MKAFPNPHRTDELGMTLRDYFAAKAMQEFMTSRDVYQNADIAEFSYEIADAMLKARGE